MRVMRVRYVMCERVYVMGRTFIGMLRLVRSMYSLYVCLCVYVCDLRLSVYVWYVCVLCTYVCIYARYVCICVKWCTRAARVCMYVMYARMRLCIVCM